MTGLSDVSPSSKVGLHEDSIHEHITEGRIARLVKKGGRRVGKTMK